MFHGVTPITSINKLAPFYYGGTPLGPLTSVILDAETCHKEYSFMPSASATIVVPTTAEKEVVVKPKSRWLPPDTLFWSVFIAVHGETEFLQIGSKYANREWEEKNMIRQEIAKNPKVCQTTNHKLTLKNVQEMMSEYMTGVSVTSILGLVGFSVYYKIPIYLVDPVKKTHLSFLPTNTDKEACFLVKNEKRYELSSEPVSLEDSFGLESYTRPLRAISTYKRPELEAIRKRFAVEVSVDLPKDALYRALSEHLVWK